MWNELAKYKNHFLQKELQNISAEPINEQVRKEFETCNTHRKLCKVPYDRVCEHSTYFDDHAKLAYGWFALPKLIYEMNMHDEKKQWAAINSLSEYLENPLHAQTAILQKDIVRLIQNTLLRFLYRYRLPKYREVERLLHTLNILSVYLNGARQISKRNNLIHTFYKLVDDRSEYMEVSASILQNLSEKPEVLLYLMDNIDVFRHLMAIFKKDVCCPYYPHALWMHLSHFLEYNPMGGIKFGFFELLHSRIKTRIKNFYGMTMKCFALLLRCSEGQNLFDDINGIELLHNILKGKFCRNYEFIILTLLNGLISKKSLLRANEFQDLPLILKHIAKHTDNGNMQLYCFKALRLLGELPNMKAFMRTDLLDKLWLIDCITKQSECSRDDLCRWLDREIYDSCPITKIIPPEKKSYTTWEADDEKPYCMHV